MKMSSLIVLLVVVASVLLHLCTAQQITPSFDFTPEPTLSTEPEEMMAPEPVTASALIFSLPSLSPSASSSPSPSSPSSSPPRRNNIITNHIVETQLDQTLDFCGLSLSSFARQSLHQTLATLTRSSSSNVKKCQTNICFAIDGSSSIPSWQFGLQKRVVSLIASLLSATNENVFYSGVQYSDTTTPIEPPTTDISMFLRSVNHVRQARQNERNIAAGLGYCGFQLFNKPTGVLLILGSGKSTTRGFSPDFVADRIRPPKGGSPVFAVSTTGNSKDFEDVVGGKKNQRNLITLRTCKDIGKAVTQFMSMIC